MSYRLRTKGGRVVPNPCSESERLKNFLACQTSDTGSGIPIGSIAFWGLSVASLPAGCVVADGVANASSAGGSGIVCVDSFLYTTGSDNALGNTLEADVTPPGGEHEHDFTTTPAEPDVTVQRETTGLVTKTGGAHKHANGVLYGGEHNHGLGTHGHDATVGHAKITSWLANGDHQHDLTIGTESIDSHTAAEVGNCFGKHPDHSHNITIDAGGGVAGSVVNGLTGVTAGVTGELDHSGSGDPLTHPDHGHPNSTTPVDGLHGHDVSGAGHDHTAEVVGPGHHVHGAGAHDHDLDILFDPGHSHFITDPGHEHDASSSIHAHTGHLHGGEHTHTAGTPRQVHMVPIERIY